MLKNYNLNINKIKLLTVLAETLLVSDTNNLLVYMHK